ncbi:MAG: alpha/beta hydrolase [Aliidongia sp.]
MAMSVQESIELYYELSGTGPKLLVISGTGGDLRRRPGLQDGPLARLFTLLVYDQRGFGRSGKPDYPYTMADYADDAAGLMNAVGWESARVLGISFGGMVAQELALRHPSRVERLALACTSPGGAGGVSYPLHELADLDLMARTRHLLGVTDIRRDAVWVAANPERAQSAVDELAAMARPIDADDPAAAMGARRQLAARSEHDTFDRLPQLAMPVGLFAGRYDGISAPAAQRAMRRQIPGATLRFFDGGHFFVLQDPAAFPAIIEFLAG